MIEDLESGGGPGFGVGDGDSGGIIALVGAVVVGGGFLIFGGRR
jgi:hypothetical protein